ncbi:MAG TPA: hypothetical protein VMD30_09280, partial [Tepidisphaeraceae bacterium]|nr:hypothetical protein [Tepidisphaeraceae bacterium]
MTGGFLSKSPELCLILSSSASFAHMDYLEQPTEYAGYESASALAASKPMARPIWLPVPFVIPVMLCGISWISGGVPVLTDCGFIALALCCVGVAIMEFWQFSRRFGIGGLILSTGTLVWFCHDYFYNWFDRDFGAGGVDYTQSVIAKAAFYTTLFTFFAMIGLSLPVWHRITRFVRRIPEPQSNNVFIIVLVLCLVIGLIPYLFFSAEGILTNIYKAMTGMRFSGAEFTAGRTGNYNYSWGGYLAQVEQVGEIGGIFAMFYVIMTPGFFLRPSKIFALLDWAFWAIIGFGTGSRGAFIAAFLPVPALLFLKWEVFAALQGRRFNSKAILYPMIAIALAFVVVQIQGAYRTTGIGSVNLEKLDIWKPRGNTMFSEGLLGYETFPDTRAFGSDLFPGSTVVMPIPDVIARWAIGWIPRVLWHDKPGISEIGQWYDKKISGGTAANTSPYQTNVSGGTVCPSVCGIAYIYYGMAGVIQIGLLFGWLCKVAERIMWTNAGRVLGTMFALGTAVYLFRAFRDLTPMDFYPLCIGTFVASILIY